MRVVRIDDAGHRQNNLPMTKDERKKIGSRLRAMRIEKTWNQEDVARRAKVAIGTVQSVEGAWREVRDSNVEKVAKVFGTSVRELLQSVDTITHADPLLERLNREDLAVARHYHDAPTPLRQLTLRLLRSEIEHDRVAAIVVRLTQVSPELLLRLEDLIEKTIESTSDTQIVSERSVLR